MYADGLIQCWLLHNFKADTILKQTLSIGPIDIEYPHESKNLSG